MCPYFFYLFLEDREEIMENISLVFLGDLKMPKGHFEIKWPLAMCAHYESFSVANKRECDMIEWSRK